MKKISVILENFKDKQLSKKSKKIIEKEKENYHKEVLKEEKARRNEVRESPEGAYISLKNVNKIYDNHVQAVFDFNLDIKKHEFIVFVGPSGCGKSTTLRMIAGLESITSGDLFIDGCYANELEPKDRDIGMVFQSYALYPHMTVYENLAFGLKVNHVSKEEIEKRVLEAAEILQITEYLNRKPSALSGGQCQRVALGRAIVRNSKVFLMDEPLSNLDAKLRVQMRSEIVKLHKALKATTIYVTHDQTEAMTMASRIVVMNKGRIQQIGTPSEIYNNPANTFVATFIGSPGMNMIKCKNINNKIVFDGNREIDMGEEFKHKYKDFYLKQIDEVNENIEKWKDVFCTREFAKKHHSSFDLSDIALENLKKEINKDKNVTDSFGNYDDEVLIKKNLMKLRLIDFVKEKIEDESLKNINELLTLKLQNINNYKVNTITYNELIDSYKEILKEVEFEKNRILNPDIEKLIDTKIKLVKAYKDETCELVLGIRPEDIHNIEELNSSNNEKFNYSVSVAELLGHEYYVHLPLKDETEIIFKMNAKKYIESNDKVEVWFDKEKIHIFDSITSNKIL